MFLLLFHYVETGLNETFAESIDQCGFEAYWLLNNLMGSTGDAQAFTSQQSIMNASVIKTKNVHEELVAVKGFKPGSGNWRGEAVIRPILWLRTTTREWN